MPTAMPLNANQNGRVIDPIMPVAVLIVTCFAGLVYVGGYWDAAGDYYHDFVGAGNTDAFAALLLGSLIALVFTIIYFPCRRLISFPRPPWTACRRASSSRS